MGRIRSRLATIVRQVPRGAVVGVLVLADVDADAKLICPPGRFVIQPLGTPRMAMLDGRELVLGRGRASVTDMCRSVRARGFYRGPGLWGFSVQADWGRCLGHPLALRARFDLSDSLVCTRLAGKLRVGK